MGEGVVWRGVDFVYDNNNDNSNNNKSDDDDNDANRNNKDGLLQDFVLLLLEHSEWSTRIMAVLFVSRTRYSET